MSTPKALDHVAILVEDLDAALTFWRDALGLTLERTEENIAEEVRIAFLPVGDSEIELLEPTTTTSGLAKYLEKRGPGMHHLCVEVPDILASMARLAAGRAEMINETPRTRDDGTQYAFVHPRSTGGVLVELYQKPGA
ncbi:MAG: methylmalonyl-CoA epimerase [Anaerolineae bacterium]|nr:methylmalonyl-CoA epimerase [Anaerolineae bacterium]